MIIEPQIIWAPHDGSQTRYMTCPFREVLYEGTRGPGKTDALLMSFAQYCGLGFGAAWRGIIFRETFPQLKDVVAKSKRWFYQIFPGIRYNESDHFWEWQDGERLYFSNARVIGDYWNYHGHEYPFIGWEELTNWADLGIYLAMFSCNRSSHGDDRMPRMVRATANPWGVGHHAVKARFIDRAPPEVAIHDQIINPVTNEKMNLTRCYIHGHWSENKALLKADPEYVANIMQETDEAKRKAWLDGDWNIAVGGIFGNFWRPAIHVLQPFNIPASWRVERSFDWGSSRPFSVGWWAIADGTEATLPSGKTWAPFRGSRIRINEWYGCKEGQQAQPNQGLEMLAEDVAKGIVARQKAMLEGGMIKTAVRPGPADASIFDKSNGQQNSIAELMSKSGCTWIPSDKSPGSRINGWELLRNMLAASLEVKDGQVIGPKVGPMEKPGIFVFDTCRHWIRTVPLLPRDAQKPDDVDTDAEDHAGDETRYEIYRKIGKSGSQEVSL
jgi:hypothetical protein